MENDGNREMIISYMTLRQLIGIMGILFPFVFIAGGLFIGHKGLQESISIYYYTNMRDLFIGGMSAVSLFLITYRGYDLADNLVTTFSGLMGLGLTFFPCMSKPESTDLTGIFMIMEYKSEIIHSVFAALFFFLLAVNSYCLFTRSNLSRDQLPPRKKTRNRVYRVCGIIIFVSLAVLGLLLKFKGRTYVTENRILILLEIVMLVSFGISWLIKGKFILKDIEQVKP